MTAAYLTELEITRQLCLPDKIGRLAMATWKMQPSFPKPAEGMGGRWFIGFRWEEIDADLVLRHRLSKSIHGSETVVDPTLAY